LILLHEDNLGTNNPTFDGDKDYTISNPGNGDEYLDVLNGEYYYLYVQEGVNGILSIYYCVENTLLGTDLLIEAGQMYVFKVVELGISNINIDFSNVYEGAI